MFTTLIAAAKLNDVDPQTWLADVLARLPDAHSRALPWNWRPQNTAAKAARSKAPSILKTGIPGGLHRMRTSSTTSPRLMGNSMQCSGGRRALRRTYRVGPLVYCSLSALGRVKKKVVPKGLRGNAQSLPPCASMIDRQMERPKPIPLDFVVKKGSKMWSR